WFNDLAREIYSLERFPERCAVIPESKKLRHLPFGKKPNTYRNICAVDKRKHLVSVLHIRHGARAALSTKEKRQLSLSLHSPLVFLMRFPSSMHQDIYVVPRSYV